MTNKFQFFFYFPDCYFGLVQPISYKMRATFSRAKQDGGFSRRRNECLTVTGRVALQ